MTDSLVVSGPNGNGSHPAAEIAPQSPVPMHVVEVDTSRAKVALLERYFDHMTGARDPLAVADVTDRFGQAIVNAKFVVRDLERRFRHPMTNVHKALDESLAFSLRSRKELTEIGRELARQPGDEKGWLTKLMGK